MTFKRRVTTLLMTFLLPVVMVSFLGLFVFTIPVDYESKLGFPVAILIAESILLTTVVEEIPVSSRKTPILGIYLLVILLLSILEIIFTIVILKMFNNKNKQKRVTDSAIKLAAFCNAVTCFSQSDKLTGSGSSTSESPIEDPQSPQTIDCPPDFKTSIKRKPSVKSISPDCSFATSRNEEFQRMRRSRAWSESGGICGAGVDRKYTWEDVARAVDRFCFVVFLLLKAIFFVVFIAILST